MGAEGAFFAVASPGTEGILADELRDLGASPVDEAAGGVRFGAVLEDAYRALMWSRVVSRVLFPLARFSARTEQDLYEGVYDIPWGDHVGPELTIAVDVTGKHEVIGSPRYIALKTKDALVDRVRSSIGRRPSVDTQAPDVRVSVHAAGLEVVVSVDLGGRGLHRRGLGRSGGDAPLKETLAAAMLRRAGWHRAFLVRPLLDPLCGSGTIVREAAWMALDVAPGLTRYPGGLGRWLGHDARLWGRLCEEARARAQEASSRSVRIMGSDASPSAIAAATENLVRAGVAGRVTLQRCDLREVEPPWPDAGLVVTNPPYGARLGDPRELSVLYEALGDVLRRRFLGWTAWVLCGNPALTSFIGLRPSSRHALWNGPIECRFFEIPISSAPVTSPRPSWRRPHEEALAFRRRLLANRTEREAWAGDQGLTCYRLYDRDLPEYNLAVDWYDGVARVEEYAPPRSVDPHVANRRLRDALTIVGEVLELDPRDVILRVRTRSSAARQPFKRPEHRRVVLVREGDLRFEVNLTDYLDTGLFLDDRILRARLRELAAGRHVLNLFAYTCTASVAAAAGGAASTTSVDLSNVYLAWGKRNFALNGLALDRHRFLRRDVLRWIQRPEREQAYDLILLAPPSHSRSKGMVEAFDLRRDHPRLLEGCLRLLAPGGDLIFTTNARALTLETGVVEGCTIREVTEELTPRDFASHPRFRAWILSKEPVPRIGRVRPRRITRDAHRTTRGS